MLVAPGLLVISGDSSSRLAPPEGVVEPVLVGEVIDGSLSLKSTDDALDRSKLKLSEIARIPNPPDFDMGLLINDESQSESLAGVGGPLEESEPREVSNLVTVGEGLSLTEVEIRGDSGAGALVDVVLR